MRTKTVVALAIYFLCSFATANNIRSLYNEEESQRGQSTIHLAELRQKLGQKVSQRHFVYVAGFLNEVLPHQFIKNKEGLKELGATAFTEIYPSSKDSVTKTAEILSDRLVRLYFNGNEKGEGRGLPIVLIGHSKGGAEVVLTVMNYPHLVTGGFVDRVVAIQSGFETPLAGLSSLGQTLCQGKLSPCRFIENLFKNGLSSMSALTSQKAFSHSYNRLKEIGLFEVISKSIYYVRSSQTVMTGLAPAIAPTGLYLKKYGANDGIILTQHQYLDYIGSDMGIMDADHAELLIHKNVLVYGEFIQNHLRARRIKSFTRALMRGLYLNN